MIAPLRFVLGLIVAAGALLLIALTGGGWWALDRLDPLLAVPGAGLAAMLGAMVAGRMRWWVALLWGLLAGVSMTVVVCAPAMIVRLSANTVEGLVWTAKAVFVAGLGAAAIMRFCQLLPLNKWQNGTAVLAATLAVAAGWQNWSWQWIPSAYTTPDLSVDMLLVSSLPLIDPAGRRPPEAIITRLQNHFNLTVSDTVDEASLRNRRSLMLFHPRALSASSLVAIDRWVRDGGHALILADGFLVWPAQWPLGDARNPPVTSLLTPLLTHWGIILDAPPGLSVEIVDRAVRDRRLRFVAPGRFRVAPRQAKGIDCVMLGRGTVLRCNVGRGLATLVSDADFIAASVWQGSPVEYGEAATSVDNAEWLVDLFVDSMPPQTVRPVWWHCNDCTR